MKVIGIDSHKATLAGCAVDELGTPVDERTLGNDRAGHVALADWARSLAVERIGIEGSGRYGAAAARQLAAAGFDVRDAHWERLGRSPRSPTRCSAPRPTPMNVWPGDPTMPPTTAPQRRPRRGGWPRPERRLLPGEGGPGPRR
ncbi:MAG TPA: transposase, partial [Candidatus Limnocylindrales bacterium]